MEISGQHDGDSAQSLTVWDAAEALAALPDDDEIVSGESETEPATPKKAPKDESPETDTPGETDTEEPEATDDEGDEADSPEVEESEDEDEQETPAAQLPKTVKVKVNGQEVEVPLEEALAGYQRQQDYTRKTQEVSEARKKFEQDELPAVRAQRQQLATALTQVEAYLTGLTQEPDWDTLQQDPASFAQVHAAWQVHEKRLAAIRQHRDALQQEIARDQQEQTKQHLAGERDKILAALPSWNDAEVAKKESKDIFDYATSSLNVTPEEFKGVTDHRVILAIRKAMLYDRAEAAKAEAAKKAAPKLDKVKTAPPGPSAKAKKPKVTELSKRTRRLAQTGSVRDAAAALEMMSDDE